MVFLFILYYLLKLISLLFLIVHLHLLVPLFPFFWFFLYFGLPLVDHIAVNCSAEFDILAEVLPFGRLLFGLPLPLWLLHLVDPRAEVVVLLLVIVVLILFGVSLLLQVPLEIIHHLNSTIAGLPSQPSKSGF